MSRPNSARPTAFAARWVLSPATRALADGAVAVSQDRISAVGPRTQFDDVVDLGDVAILPGFVNAHTHLDLSHLRGKCPPSPDFIGWLREIIRARRESSPQAVAQGIAAGLAECLRTGTTTVADISSGGASWPTLQDARVRAFVFYELLGLSAERARAAWQGFEAWLDEHPATATCFPAVSPHAPYSCHRDLFTRAHAQWLNVATHVAESPAELELLATRTGPFVPFLQELGVWEPDGLIPSLEWLRDLQSNGVPTLWAHGNYLPADWQPAMDQAVVYCPRTHAAFGHAPYPLAQFARQGVTVALGTDSLASNPDLDLLAEARFLWGKVDGAELLAMLTINGASALGIGALTGSLDPGKSADLAVVPLPASCDDPYEAIFASDRQVTQVMFMGEWRSTDL